MVESSDDPDGDRSRAHRIAWQLVVCGALLIGIGIVLGTVTAPLWMTWTLLGAGLVALLAGTLVGVLQRVLDDRWDQLRRWFHETELRRSAIHADELKRAQGLALIDCLPPGEVLGRLLRRTYGDHPANEAVIRSVLGGAGRELDCHDLSVSTRTRVVYDIVPAVPGTIEITSTVEFSFANDVPDTVFILFVTCDHRLRELLVECSDHPFFDWWYVPDEHEFREGHAAINRLDVGFQYVDASGDEREMTIGRVQPTWVKFEQWVEYLSFLRQPHGTTPPWLRPDQLMRTLKIYQVDLAAMVKPHRIASVRELTVRSATLHPDDRGCYWMPAFPCYLESIGFRAELFATDADGGELEFMVNPYLSGGDLVARNVWVPAEEVRHLPVETWVLPGHAVDLRWQTRVDSDGR
ncbi:hypothetical protein [Pseudonocardia sp.]|uniref:hypothetical protein n=1 Tax=Pseudonocardia sp. TaxID=60912 RepID=UPI003D130836